MHVPSNYTLVCIAVASALPITAFAHDDEHGRHAAGNSLRTTQTPFGIAGDSRKVSRTIDIDMTDAMRFVPAVIDVKVGETIRFRLKNTGKTLHEMVIGRLPDLEQHAAMMRKSSAMNHAEPYMVHVKPGSTGEMVWTFNRAGEFSYACLIPGHFEAGMVGKAIVATHG